MRVATIRVSSLTPYSQSRALQSEKRKEESHDEFDARVWPEHIYANASDEVFIPGAAIIQGMAAAASYLSKGGQLKKKGAATWAENFRCALAISKAPTIGQLAGDAKPERVFCHADGRRGSGKRVWRTFPIFDDWEATLTIHILDDTIPEDVLRQVVDAFGLFIGIGRYRPQNGGDLGRFEVKTLTITETK